MTPSERITADEDVEDVIAILRINYERVVARYGTPIAAQRASTTSGITRLKASA